MEYTWYEIFNKDEFLATGLVSRTYTFILDNIGEKKILVTNGNEIGMTYDDVFLVLNLNDNNPFAFEGHAIYIDGQNNVYLGIEIES